MKTNLGRFFEDYRLGETIIHAAPRTIGGGERAMYHALYPARHALYSSDEFARGCGLPASPLDDLAAFHIVFGKTGTGTVQVTSLDGSEGFRIVNPLVNERMGSAVAGGGDINGDGFADVIVGASNGSSYVVYGSATGADVDLTAATIAASKGFKLTYSTANNATTAQDVSFAGDFDGDGLTDLVIAEQSSTTGYLNSYKIVFGGTQWLTTPVIGNGAVTGTAASEAILGSTANDTLSGGGGVDRFFAGMGNDTIVLTASDVTNLGNVAAGQTAKASVNGGGGFDTLRMSGGAALNLTAITNAGAMGLEENSRIESIERIDMATDTAANTLTLSSTDVNDMSGFNLIRTGSVSADGKTWTNVSSGTALSATTRFHQLVVDGSGSDVVNLKSGAGTWTNAGTVNDGTNNYVVWQNGSTSSQVIVRSGVTVNSNVAPVVLDLNRDGQIDYSRVLMDANTDGTLDSVLWAGSQDGVLVWDKYHDGQIHHFSQYAFTQYGGNTDLEGLAAGFDTNQDGVFSLKDEQFLAFKVWQDKDQDGVVDAGEMRSLGDVGIASIDLASDGVKRTPVDGVEEAGRSSATTTDGQSILVADASFEFTTANPQAMEPGVYSLSLGQSLDLSQLVGATHATPTALAQIDMGSDVSANVLSLSLNDVLSLPATNGVHQLKVTGAANDKLMLAEGEWTDTGAVVDQGGQRYALYTGTSDSTAQLLVDQQLLQAHQSN